MEICNQAIIHETSERSYMWLLLASNSDEKPNEVLRSQQIEYIIHYRDLTFTLYTVKSTHSPGTREN